MSRLYRYDSGTFLVFVDRRDADGCVGRFLSPCLGESGHFRSLDQLLLQLDGCMDIHDEPQAFHTVRYFSPMAGIWSQPGEGASVRPGAVANFCVQVRFRRGATWQGTVTWLETQRTEHFRSVLELLRLMDSALAAGSFPDSQTIVTMEG